MTDGEISLPSMYCLPVYLFHFTNEFSETKYASGGVILFSGSNRMTSVISLHV